MKRTLLAFLIGLGVATAAPGLAADTALRYTADAGARIRAHHCTEDEYAFIPSRWVNRNVVYDTPNRVMCVAIENTRRAPAYP